MNTVFPALLRACETDGAVLVTVVKATGSSPRSAGACMAVGQQGRLAGTIGGGALELEATAQALAHLLEKKSATARFDLSIAAGDLGMVCGGDVQLLYSYLPPREDVLRAVALVEACLQTHSAGRLVLPLAGGIGFIDAEGRLTGTAGLPADGYPPETGMFESGGRTYFVQSLIPPGNVILIGAGHLAQALAHLLPWLGFPYDVVDDRPEYADPKLFPGADSIQTLPYTELDQLTVRPEDYIVILTDGHRGDYEAEKWALGTPAAYIGVVGSAKKTAYVRGLLEKDGFTAADLDRVAAPIGLPIGSDTPPEIAVSIAAQIIERRADARRATRENCTE